MHYWDDWHWGFGYGHWIFGVLFWLLILLAIVALVRWLGGAPAERDRAITKTAIEILEERYARGELDREEFEQKKRDLQG